MRGRRGKPQRSVQPEGLPWKRPLPLLLVLLGLLGGRMLQWWILQLGLVLVLVVLLRPRRLAVPSAGAVWAADVLEARGLAAAAAAAAITTVRRDRPAPCRAPRGTLDTAHFAHSAGLRPRGQTRRPRRGRRRWPRRRRSRRPCPRSRPHSSRRRRRRRALSAQLLRLPTRGCLGRWALAARRAGRCLAL